MACVVSSGHQLNKSNNCVHCGTSFSERLAAPAQTPRLIDPVFVTADCSGARCSIDGQPVDDAGTCNNGHVHGEQYKIG